MPAIWDTPYGHAMLKIERANKHIKEFDLRLLSSSNHYGPSIHINAQTGEKYIHYRLNDYMLRGDLAVIVGDVAHNLRSALYFVWVSLVRRNGFRVTSQTHFPIRKDQGRNWLESVLTQNAGVHPTSPIFDFLVNNVKAYQGGDSDILALHDLDVDDKHILLIPMVSVTGIKGLELENEDGSLDCFDILLKEHEVYRKVIPLETKFKKHGEVQFHVTFAKGAGIQDAEIVATLKRISRKVLQIVRTIEIMR